MSGMDGYNSILLNFVERVGKQCSVEDKVIH